MVFQCPPKLTPLQSRFIASFAALIALGLIYWSLSSPNFAYAEELSLDGSGQVRGGEDHNWHRIEQERLEQDGIETGDEIDTSGMEKRAITTSAIGGNNVANSLNIEPGNTTRWSYSNELLLSNFTSEGPGLPGGGIADKRDVVKHHAELRKRQDSTEERTIYVSINTCLQPSWNSTGTQTAAPPQLTLYVATKANHTDVGPGGTDQIVQPLEQGFANVSVSASGTWYLAVHAPALSDDFTDVWNYEVAVSIDDYYHRSDPSDPFLYLIDTDIDSALLVTDNVTQANASSPVFQQWMNLTDPFIMFAANVNHTGTLGIERSYCGWSKQAQLIGTQSDPSGDSTPVQMGMTTRGLGNKPKEQFYVTNLNGSSGYTGVLAMTGNSTASGSGVVGGGGKVWKPVPWTTKTDGNCALLFNLSFCGEVAYAVPHNPNNPNVTDIEDRRTIFDNYTTHWYQKFDYSLQQTPCNTTASAQYSLARNCDDCADAYKEWLCAVSIPRCEDFTNTNDWLQIRNVGQPFYNNDSMLDDEFLQTPYDPMHNAPTLPGSSRWGQTYISSMATNQSRNPLIDETIKPGPYKEVLPCEDLCYSLVQSCPSSMLFACPYPGRGLEVSYGKRNYSSGGVQCSYLGAYYSLNSASGTFAPWFKAAAFATLAGLVVGVV